MIWEALSNFVGSGGLTGAITGVATIGAKIYEKQLDQAQERARWQHEAQLHRLNAEHERWLGEQELLIESERVAGDVLSVGIDADSSEAVAAFQMKGMHWAVGAIRTLTRPALTVMLIALVALIWARTTDASLEQMIVSAMLGGMLSALSFWFAGRVLGNAPQR